MDELLRGLLVAEDFSADVAVEVTTVQGEITFSSRGSGSIDGAASQLDLITDLSSLDGTFIDPRGRIIGRGGLTETTSSSILADGVLYQRDDGDRWRVDTGSLPNTTLGHVFSALAAVERFEESDVTRTNGRDLTIMRPSEPVDYDLQYMDVNPSLAASVTTDTEDQVDDRGVPRVVQVSLDTDRAGGLRFDYVFALSAVGSAPPVMAPDTAWVGLSSFGAGTPQMVELEIPSDWQLLETADDSSYILENPAGAIVGVFQVHFGQQAGALEAFEWFEETVGVAVAGLEQVEGSVFPAHLGTLEESDNGRFIMLYQQVFFGDSALASWWNGPLDQIDEQRADYLEVLSTARLVNNDPGSVPGNTMASQLLESDTLNLLLPTAAGERDCGNAVPLWSEIVSGDGGSWIEEWYLGLCANIEVWQIAYGPSADGGTAIEVSGPLQRIPGDDPIDNADG